MKKVIAFILLITPLFVSAKTESETKTVYETIASELLKDCTGVDKKIAVAGFSYSDGRDSRDGGVVAERITTELVKVNKFRVIERKEIEKVFVELKFQHSGAIDPDSAKEIGKMVGADWIVVGTLTELPNKQLELNARIVGVESGEILSASSGGIEKDWLDQYRKLIIEENKKIERTPTDVNAFYERGRVYADLGEYDNAIGSLGIAITINPAYFDAYFSRGNVYWYKGEYDKAVEDYSKAITLNHNDADVYYNRGLAYSKKGDCDKANEDFSKAAAIDSKLATAISRVLVIAYVSCGNTYRLKGEYDKAIKDYSKAIEISPEDVEGYFRRGQVYLALGTEAMKNYTEALKMSDYGVPTAQAFSYYDNKGYNKALEDFSKVIELRANYAAEAYAERAIVYHSLGVGYDSKNDYRRALNDATMAIKLNPENQPKLEPLIYMTEKNLRRLR